MHTFNIEMDIFILLHTSASFYLEYTKPHKVHLHNQARGSATLWLNYKPILQMQFEISVSGNNSRCRREITFRAFTRYHTSDFVS